MKIKIEIEKEDHNPLCNCEECQERRKQTGQ